MADYYGIWNARYMWVMQQGVINYRFKLELLDQWERSYAEIVSDVSDDVHYSININKEQGMRRTCTCTFIDPTGKYLPSINNPFWYNKKFKLYTGVADGGDTYWFPQGIFICNNASAERHMVTINGVDKYGFLDGTLNVHMMQETYKVEVGTKLGELVRHLLMLEIGNGMPIDPIEPLIDGQLEQATTITEIQCDPGRYLGDILTEVASMFGADIYYDVNGRLNVRRIFNDDVPFYYIYRGAWWHFNDMHEGYIQPNVNYEMDGVNYIFVSTDNTEGEVYSWTAVNNAPDCPIAVSKVGYRRDKDNPINYIPLGDTTYVDDPTEKCRQYAEYLLFQKSCPTLAVSFSAPMLPHLDVGEIVTITDSYFGYDNESFLIQAITSNGIDAMSISVVNIKWLPSDTYKGTL